jgi:LysM repeat protein
MTFSEKQQMIGKTTPASPVISTLQPGPDGDYVTYTVRYGDTIWDIVKMFENVSTTDVLTLNNITDPGKIKVGQILKIKKKS